MSRWLFAILVSGILWTAAPALAQDARAQARENFNSGVASFESQDFESAYRIFTVLNERGLDLTHTDILKSEIIGEIPQAAQDAYTATWEQEEEDLGRADFADLFSHIRMVYAKNKARESILKEFRTAVLSRFPDRRDFINKVLVPLSNAFEANFRVRVLPARLRLEFVEQSHDASGLPRL